jgi:predicted type IV restriction endonuclease
LFIEAKKLSIDIEQRDVINQLAKYCFGHGMNYGVIANGVIWILLRAFPESTTIAERKIWKTDLENYNIIAVLRRLNTTSKNNITDIENIIKKMKILEEIWYSLSDEPKDLIRGFIPVFGNLIKEGYPDYEFDQAKLKTL